MSLFTHPGRTRRIVVLGCIGIFLFSIFGPTGMFEHNNVDNDIDRYQKALERHKAKKKQKKTTTTTTTQQQHHHPIENFRHYHPKSSQDSTNKKVFQFLHAEEDMTTTKKEQQQQQQQQRRPPSKPDVAIIGDKYDVDRVFSSASSDQNRPPPDADALQNFNKSADGHYVKQTTDAEGNLLPFPVYQSLDENVPEDNSKIASEKLECRASVIEFVINATDVKDECEGLRKAFDASCSIGEGEVAGSVFSSQDTPPERRRRLSGGGGRMLQMLGMTRQMVFRGLVRNQEGVGEQLEEAWEKIRDGRRQMQYQQQIVVVPEQSSQDAAAAGGGEQTIPLPPPGTNTNKVSTKISLPSASQHVTDHMFTDALLFQEKPVGLAGTTASSEKQQSPNMGDATEAVSTLLFTPEAEELKTCCASIMDVYHEHCDRPEEEELNDQRLILIVSVIALCSLVKSLIRHFEIRWLPEAAGCILVGVIGGIIMKTVPHVDIGFDEKLFLRVMLPPIAFEAALNINKQSFHRHAIPIFLYACIGTMISTVLTAYFVYITTNYISKCVSIPFIESLTFGALISSIDPIAVLSVLNNMGMRDTDTIYVLIFGESLLNDGVAIVLFDTLVHFLDDSLVLDSTSVWAGAIHFLIVALGSVFFGVLSGACCTAYFWAMHGCQSPLVEVIAFVCWALIPYYVCDGIRWSGIVAIVAAGIVMDIYVVGNKNRRTEGNHVMTFHCPAVPPLDENKEPKDRRRVRAIFSKEGHMSAIARTHIGFVTEIIATLMETAIFAYLGLFLFNSRYHWNFYLSVISISSCIVGRGVMVPILSFVANWLERIRRFPHKRQRSENGSLNSSQSDSTGSIIIDKRMQMVLLFAGLRGAVSFALVENIPLFDSVSGHGSRLKPELKSMTSASIVFTVFVLGGSTFYLLERLGLSMKKDQSNMEMTSLLETRIERKHSDVGHEERRMELPNEVVPERVIRQRGSGLGV